MTASPKKVMAKTTPAAMVSATKARPTPARADPVTRNQSSDQVRLVNGARKTSWATARTRVSSSSETTIIISVGQTRICTPVSTIYLSD